MKSLHEMFFGKADGATTSAPRIVIIIGFNVVAGALVGGRLQVMRAMSVIPLTRRGEVARQFKPVIFSLQ